MSSTSVEGIDFEAALAQYQMERVFCRILGVYLKSVPDILATLAAFKEEELQEYITTVHGLKGASYGIYANVVGDLAKELEGAGKSGNIAFIREHNQQLISETEALLLRLKDYMDTQG